jgi:hypothetical protein
LCSIAQQRVVHYLWRPTLKDPHDDMVVELAVSAECSYIITHNISDFRGIEPFGISAIPPKDFLKKLEAIP